MRNVVPGKFKRARGVAPKPPTLRCQRKNKRHVKHCDEWQARQYWRTALETPLVRIVPIRRGRDV